MRLGCLVLGLCALAPPQERCAVQRLVSLDYPALAQQARIQGTVEIACAITKAGEVLKCVGNSGHALLQNAAIANAMKWLFRCAEDAHKPAEDFVLRYDFVLTESPPVRRAPKVEFIFEYPNTARIISEIPCGDHVPCTPDERRAFEKQQERGKAKRQYR